MPRSSLSIALAVLLDALTLAAVVFLLHAELIPREVGSGLLGALIGARARWLADGPAGGPGAPLHVGGGAAPPQVSGAVPRATHASDTAREALERSALGVLFWPVFRFGGVQ